MRLLDHGDTALTIEFGDRIEKRWLTAVTALDEALAQAMANDRLPGVVETVPTFRSLTLVYDPLLTSRAAIEGVLRQVLPNATSVLRRHRRRWRLPVCYGDQLSELGPDLDDLAAASGLSSSEVVRVHSSMRYVVYLLGFLPGFAFLGDLAPALVRPRRREPRLRVPAGSVAVASTLTAIYPWDSPGGWHLIGRCPIPLFSPDWPEAALLQAGDEVGFRCLDLVEYRELASTTNDTRHVPRPPFTYLEDHEPPDACHP